MARDEWLSRSPRGTARWGGRWTAREPTEIGPGYGATYRGEEEGAAGPAGGRRARERWGYWRGEYGGYEEEYGRERRAARRGARPSRLARQRSRPEEEEWAYGTPYYDRMPFRSRRRYERGEPGYGWPVERRMFRPYEREFQGDYGEEYRGLPPGYTGEYTWGRRPRYRAWRRGGRWGGRPYGEEYGW
ncbi:MAG TPA: hypothetical protein VIL18_12060 [Longimicrobiales bacterium]